MLGPHVDLLANVAEHDIPLHDPKGAVMSNRSWDLETIVPGDQITLTYTVEYASSTVPGTYHNVARVTGKRNYTGSTAPDMIPVEFPRDVTIVPNGLVLGVSTSTPKFATSSITVAPSSCVPLLTNFMKQGQQNDPTQVMKLQSFLNSTQGARLPVSGFYGSMTTSAVKNFQLKYKNEILVPLGITRPTGNVYGSTQRKINLLNCGGDPTPTSIQTPSAPAVISSAPPSGQSSGTTNQTASAAKVPPKKTVPAPVKAAPPAKQTKLLKTVGTLFSKLW